MSSKHYHEETIRHPHALTDRDLYDMALRDISRKLSLTTSVRTTMEVYLRWLEVHRTRPSSRTKSWDNLVWQWGQSLRQRGIRESELIKAVRNWKDEHGPFTKSERMPPKTKDIEKAFDDPALPSRNKSDDLVWKRADPGTHEPAARRQDHQPLHPDRLSRLGREREKDHEDIRHSFHPDRLARVERERERDEKHDRRERGTSYEKTKSHHYSSKAKPSLESYMQPPPPNYICNRCNKSGHHLQACPTNMNPDFDLPPDRSYVCSICGETGTHYKSLCPLNPDPFSIIQRRNDAGYETGLKVEKSWNAYNDPRKRDELEKVRDYDRACRSSTRDCESRNSSLYGSTPPSSKKQEQKDRLREIDEKRLRLSREEIEEVVDSGYAGTGELGLNSRRKRAFSDTSDKGSYSQSPATPTWKKNCNVDDKLPPELANSNTLEQVEELLLAERGPPRGGSPHVYQLNPDDMQLDDNSQHSSSPIPSRQKSGHIVVKLPSGEREKADLKVVDINTSKGVDKLSLAERGPSGVNSPSPPPAYRSNPDEMILDNGSQDSTDISVYYSAVTSRAGSAAVFKNTKKSPRDFDSSEEGQVSSSDDMDVVCHIEAKVPPKIYSDFVNHLVLKNPEMNTIRNPIKKRPQAFEMWEQDSRRQNAPREFSHLEKRMMPQFDGPCDEIPVEVSNRRRKYKLAGLGKDTIGRVKGAAKEFPKLRSRSKARPLTNQTEPLISRSPTPPSPCPKDVENSFPQRPPNIPRVMVTSLPSTFREKELPQLPDTIKLSMQAGSSWTDTNSSTDLDESKLLNDTSKSRSQPDFSTRWDSRRSIHNSSVFSRRSSSREGTLSESRSTNEFRSTVRKIIEESKSEDSIRSQSQDNLNLPVTPRANFLRTMSASPETKDHSTETMNQQPEMIEVRKEVQIKKASCRYNREDLENMAAAKNATRREKTIKDLKSFAGGFKLGTPVPKDIAELCKGNKQNGNDYEVKEESGAQDGETSGGVEMRQL